MLKPLSTGRKIQKSYIKMPVLHANNVCITVKFCTRIAYDMPILHTKENFEIFPNIIDNDIIMLKLEQGVS